MASAQWADGLFLKIVNVVAYFLSSWFNIYSIVSPQSSFGSVKQTYFTPASSVFFIWPIIHVLLFGTVIYQFTSPQAKAVVIDGISWRLPFLLFINTFLFISWDKRDFVTAFVLSPIATLVAWRIYLTVREIRSPGSWGDELFVHLPFSMWHAWTNVVVLLTAFQLLGVDATEHLAGAWTKIFVFIALLYLEVIAMVYAHGDLPGASIMTWTLWAIFDHQRSSLFVHWSALVFALLSITCVLYAALFLLSRITVRALVSNREESPLLGN